MEDNFKELKSVEEANRVDMRYWKLIGFDPAKGYVFARRVKVLV